MVTGYRISNEFDAMDLTVIHGFISNSYWGTKIPFEIMRRAAENSLCFGVFTSAGQQIGFARMVTDKATFAYLADVFILDDHRGIGLSKWLMETILAHPDLQGLRRMVLATKDAHSLYEQFGFKPLANPDIFMELWNPKVYNKT